MEVAQTYFSDFWKCVQYHTTTWSNRAVHEVTHFNDVAEYVAADVAENQSLRERIAEARALEAQRRAARKLQVDDEKRQTAELRKGFALQAKPLLERYDSISLAKHYFSETLNLVAQQEYGITQLQERETGNYGYQSKKLISVGLSLDTLRRRMTEGKPFAQELKALVDDADSADVAIVSSPLQGVAAIGLPKLSELRTSALAVATAMEESAKFRPSGAPGWFDMLKFRSVVQPGTPQTHQMQLAMARDTAQLFLAKVDKEDWSGALKLADKEFSQSTTSASVRDAAYQSALDDFKRVAMPQTAATQFLDYATASLTCTRMAYVEQMLKLD
jgi:hypothetical protein